MKHISKKLYCKLLLQKNYFAKLLLMFCSGEMYYYIIIQYLYSPKCFPGTLQYLRETGQIR